MALSVEFWRAMHPTNDGDWFMAVPGRLPRTYWLIPNRIFERESGALPHHDTMSDDLFAFLVDEVAGSEELRPDGNYRVGLSDELLSAIGASRKKPDNELVVTPFNDRLILWSAASFAAFKKEMEESRGERRQKVQPELRTLRTSAGGEGGSGGGPHAELPVGWKTYTAEPK
ncbi:MAG: hypothetical protein SF069_12120 [Phycisphaerae bacterium]|nr:hypothetical protein [Phycisphaerae bacterium]